MKHLHGSLLGILHFVFPCKKKWTELILAISLNHCMVSCSLSFPLKLLSSAENRQRNKSDWQVKLHSWKCFMSHCDGTDVVHCSCGNYSTVSQKKNPKQNKGQALLFLCWSRENTMLIVSFYFFKQCLAVRYEHLLSSFAANLLGSAYVLPG